MHSILAPAVTPIPLQASRSALRAAQPAPRNVSTQVSWVGAPARQIHALSRDISGRGVFLVCNETPELGTMVELELSIDERTPVRTLGVVVRTDSGVSAGSLPGFAVLFTELSDLDADQLLELLDGCCRVA